MGAVPPMARCDRCGALTYPLIRSSGWKGGLCAACVAAIAVPP